MAGKDDFFELRGDSLSLVRLTLAIEGFGMKMQYQVNSLLGWNSRRRLLSIVALSLFIASSSVGASPTQNRFLYIPLISTDSFESRLVLTNPSLDDTTVVMMARNYAGVLLEGPDIINPVSMVLRASSSRSLRAKEIFGRGVTAGWVQLETTSLALSGVFFLSQGAELDATELNSEPTNRLVFLKATTDIRSGNRLLLINTSDHTLSPVTVSLIENSGRLIVQRNISLPAFAAFTGGIADFAPDLRAFDGYVVAESKVEGSALIGFETYRNQSDIAALAAVPDAARLSSAYLPQFGRPAGGSPTLVFVNYGNTSQKVTVTAALIDPKTLPFGAGDLVLKIVDQMLAPNERTEVQLDQLRGFDATLSIPGYVRFETERDGLFSYLEWKTASGSALTAAAPQGTGYSDLRFPSIENGAGYFTALLLTNGGSQASLITIDAFDSGGNPTGAASLTLESNARWSGFLSDLLPGTQNQTNGSVHITASSPVLATEVVGTTAGAVSVVPPGGAVLVAQPSGQLVSARKGAIVVSTDGAASIAIPPGALSEDTPIQLTSLRVGDFPNPSENEHLIGVVGGTPDGTRFRIPVRVRFLLAESIDPGALIDMLTFNAGTMQYASGEFAAIADQSGWTLSADVTHFTQFAVATGSARLQISDITPSIASVGATITVSGSGFSSIPNQNMVLFTSTRGNGTVTAVPLTASPGSLTVNVPSVATSGDVDVKVGSLRSHGMYLTVTTNQPPQMDAGPNQTINLPTGVLLSGTATDDGLPNGSLITTWSKVTGPGEVIFGNATGATDGPTGQAVSVNPSTPARFSVPGTYSLRLTASDGQFSSSSDVVVSVNPAVINGLAVSAGPDQTINVPSGANVSGTVTDTCSSCTLTTTWSQISGPGTATFADATALTTSVTFSVAGTYVLQLTTSNGVASSASIVTITVSLSSVGHMYFVDFVNGNDANSGTSPGSPWKHAPGDDNATGAANIILQPGDTVVFKGGVVYSGTSTQRGDRRVVAPNNSGTSVSPITLISGHMLSSPWGTGRAVIDGGGPGIDAAKTGIYVWDQAWITIQGFEIRNMGGPTPRASGIEFFNEGNTPGLVDNGVVNNCLIHDINWSGSYVIGYGIENNEGANHLYEKNEIYHATDKLIETFGGGGATPGSDFASNAIIRYNILHNAAVHCVVLTSDNAQFYDNLIWQCNDGAIAFSPSPGFAVKVDHGRNNKIFNNIVYDVNSGLGVLVGTGNVIAHNIVYGVGLNGSGPHQANDEGGLVFYNNNGAWPSDAVSNNKFYNNIVYYIPIADRTDWPKFIFHDASGGSDNEVKNNVFFALSGDTATTDKRIRWNSASLRANGTNSYFSLSDWQSQFNTLMNGTGNVASGNVVVDPVFVGGTLDAITNGPSGFTPTFADVNTLTFHLRLGSPADIPGVVLPSPFNIDLQGNTRTLFRPGVYDSTIPSKPFRGQIISQ